MFSFEHKGEFLRDLNMNIVIKCLPHYTLRYRDENIIFEQTLPAELCIIEINLEPLISFSLILIN